MPFLLVEDDKVVPLSDIFPHGFLFVQMGPELVEISRLEPGAVTDVSCVGDDFL